MRESGPMRLLAFLPFLLLAACDDDGSGPEAERFRAELRPGNEVTAPSGNVANATGTAEFTVRTGTATTVDFTLTASGLTSTVTGAHIHAPAAAGENAGVIVDLLGAAGVQPANFTGSVSGSFGQGNIRAGQQAVTTLDALLELMRTGRAYVNVHTTTNGPGEIRGQIERR